MDHTLPLRALIERKLRVPAPFAYELARGSLNNLASEAKNAKLVLVRAAAGFGKTTFMRQLYQACRERGVAVAWLTLEMADNDLARSVDLFSAALDEVARQQRDGTADETSAATTFQIIDRLRVMPVPFYLILDEFESIRNPSALGFWREVIRNLPAGAHVVVGSRVIPNLGLGKLRADNALLDIDSAKLRFSLSDAEAFFRLRSLELSKEDIAKLHQRTEGWPAALWLASLSAEKGEPISRFLDDLSGSDRAISDYLAETILDQKPEPIRRFMVSTSILDDLTASMCEAVTDQKDSAAILVQLESENLLTQQIDHYGNRCYRYHSLLSDFLRQSLADFDLLELQRLHQAAAHQYLKAGRPLRAIEHALRSGDRRFAIELVAQHGERLLAAGRVRLVARLTGELTPEERLQSPVIAAIHAWAVHFTHGPHEALPLIDELEAKFGTATQSPVRDHLLALRPVVLESLDDPVAAYAAGKTNLDLISDKSAFANGMLKNLMAAVAMINGHYKESRQYAKAARSSQSSAGDNFNAILAETVEGALDLMQGRLQQALARLKAAAGPQRQLVDGSTPINIMTAVLLAESLYEIDDLAGAERLLQVYVPFSKELVGLPDQIISGHVVLARIYADRSEDEQAHRTLVELEKFGLARSLPRAIACAKFERARICLLRGDVDAARDVMSASDAHLGRQIRILTLMANDIDSYLISRARLQIHTGRARKAISPLLAEARAAETAQRYRFALKLQILLADAYSRSGQEVLGFRVLDKALPFAAREGFVRPFIEEGAEIRKFVTAWRKVRQANDLSVPESFLDRISQGAPVGGGNLDASSALLEPLTPKELEVIALAREGFSNNRLASQLFVSEATVRTHLRHINGKLGTRSRGEAVAKARKLGLIPG